MNLGEKYYARIQLWGKTKEDWNNENPILRLNEMGIETDTNRFKFGDGKTPWSTLKYQDEELALSGLITTKDYVDSQISAIGDTEALLDLLFQTSSKTGGTDGLSYTLLSDNSGYAVSSSSNEKLQAIPSTHESSPVLAIANQGFAGKTELSNIYIPESVATIGAEAFKGCSKLKSDGITESITTIGDYAFENCTGLSSFTINYNTSIGKNPIKNCPNIMSISMRLGDSAPTLGVSGNAIYNNENTLDTLLCGCSGTTSIDYNTSTIAEEAFYGASKLNLSLSNAQSLQTIGARAFFQCTGMTQVAPYDYLSEIDAQAFYGCTGLKSIIIPGLGSTLTIDPTAFRGCTNVETISVNVDKTNAGNYSEGNCLLDASKNIIFGCMNSVIPTDAIGIGEYAFWNCKKLGEIVIPNSVTTVGANAFLGCTNALILCEAESKPSGWASNWVPSDIPVFWGYTGKGENQGLKWINTTSGAVIYQYLGTGPTLNIPEIVSETVKSISQGAFSGSSSLESITLPFVGGSKDATSASKSTLFGYIFGTSPYEGGVETTQYYGSGGRPIKRATYYIPSSLKSVTIIGGDLLYGAFYNCQNLTSITIGSGVTSIGSSAFYNCTNVQTYDFSSCTSIPTLSSTNAFSGINANCKIRVPASLYSDWITATNWSTYASYIEAVEV